MIRATILALTLSATAAIANPLIISDDMGGPLEDRMEILANLRGSDRPVIIRGKCYSSCTLYLGLPQTCVEPQAVFGFHGPSSSIYGLALPPDEFEYWSRIMADHYPPALAEWFMAKGRNVIVGGYFMSGSEVIRLGARECE